MGAESRLEFVRAPTRAYAESAGGAHLGVSARRLRGAAPVGAALVRAFFLGRGGRGRRLRRFRHLSVTLGSFGLQRHAGGQLARLATSIGSKRAHRRTSINVA